MSFQEKRSIVVIISSILITFFYFLFIYERYLSEDLSLLHDLKFCGTVILVMIPISIVLHILVLIFFHIIYKMASREEIPSFSDERDKLIELKSNNISHYLFILGFFLAMGSLVLEKPPYVMLIVLVASGMVSSIFGELAKLYFYRKGV